MIGLLLLFSCQEEKIISHDDHESTEEECINTFPATEIPNLRITDYSQTLPTREDVLPQLLSNTGLYSDIETKEIHPAMYFFIPQFSLWSDGAIKKRWAYIPECETIDTQDINDWQFPVGSRFFKEFSVDGMLVETRIIERIGTGPRDFAFASYLWNEDESEAERVSEEGVQRAKDTDHDIPSRMDCLRCHGSYATGGGRPSRGLGFSAMQLSHDQDGITLQKLIDDNRLSHPPDEVFSIPGDVQTQQALGYLHANCGSCHNQSKDGLPQFDMNLWLDVGFSSPESTGVWTTTVDTQNQIFHDQHVDARIVSGIPARSSLVYRMKQRGNIGQMPPIASHKIDEEGLQIISEWIGQLP
jgi:hypothetical protein